MAKYEIITPHGVEAPYSLTGSMYVGGPPFDGYYTAGSSLVGWWRFQDLTSFPSSGDAPDSSGQDNPATSFKAKRPDFSISSPGDRIQPNSVLLTQSPDIQSATIKDLAADSVLSFGDGETDSSFSIAARVRRPSLSLNGAYGTIIHKGKENSADEVEYQLVLWDNNTDGASRVQFKIGDRSEEAFLRVQSPAESLTADEWHSVVVTYDGTAKATLDDGGSSINCMAIYIDGRPQPLEDNSLNPLLYVAMEGSTERFRMGARGSGGGANGFEGNLADIAIWNRELTEIEIAAIANAASGPIYWSYRNFHLVGYGQRLSPTGSQERLSLQGLDARPDDVYFPSLLPRIRQGAPMSIWRQGEKISDKYFDDTLSFPHSGSTSLRGENDVKINMRMNFEWEKLNFGQAPVVQQGESFVETNPFNAVDFITSPESTFWPVNLFNLGSLLDHEFDGVIEPLDIRSELLGLVRSRFEGHSVRGSLMGPASETYFGSKLIVDKWRSDDGKTPFFLDAPINWSELTPSASATWDSLPVAVYSNITTEPDRPFVDHDAFEQTVSTLVMNNPQLPGGIIPYNLALSPPGFSFGSQLSLPWANELLAWWRLNRESSSGGTVPDSSGNGRDATFSSTPTVTSAETPMPYIQETVQQFVNESDKIFLGTDAVWEPLIGGAGDDAKPFSISAWFNAQALGSSFPHAGKLIEFGFASRTIITTHPIDPDYDLGLRFDCGAGTPPRTQDIFFNTWYHMVWTYSGGSNHGGNKKARVYINGVQHDVETQTAIAIASGHGYLGGDHDGGSGWAGYIADVSIWSRRLLWAEVQALYSARNGISRYDLKDDTLIAAMRQMNSTAYPTIDHAERRANHGFYFGQNAGSIVYGDE